MQKILQLLCTLFFVPLALYSYNLSQTSFDAMISAYPQTVRTVWQQEVISVAYTPHSTKFAPYITPYKRPGSSEINATLDRYLLQLQEAFKLILSENQYHNLDHETQDLIDVLSKIGAKLDEVRLYDWLEVTIPPSLLITQQTVLKNLCNDLIIPLLQHAQSNKNISSSDMALLLDYIRFYAHFLGHTLEIVKSCSLTMCSYLDSLYIPRGSASGIVKLSSWRKHVHLAAEALTAEINLWFTKFNTHSENPRIQNILLELKTKMLAQAAALKETDTSWFWRWLFPSKDTNFRLLKNYYQVLLTNYFLELLHNV